MNKYFLFFFFLIQYSYSQEYRVIYDFNYKLDSLKNYSENIEMVLDIQKDYSKFYYKKLIKLDSLVRSRAIISYGFPIQQVVKRKTGLFVNENFVNVADKYYNYPTTDDIHWEILSDTKLSDNHKLQKAEAKWGGRKWIAWFSTEIPVSEGPYKFRGLPGLIFEVKDSKDNFNYKLVSINKSLSEYDTSNIVETNLGMNPISITLKQFQKILINNYNNPFSEYYAMKEGTWGLTIFDKHISSLEGLKSIKKDYQLQIAKNYNPIELDKAVKYK
ncbi:GLPGLI family protein [Chryseobacterium sp. GP-SGM7]|uniref:GLPGLI family protein n=1 Tax=Chryseobacterium sp. GP-SGM7 TaxID=3411323 RepID=UPI003B942DA4